MAEYDQVIRCWPEGCVSRICLFAVALFVALLSAPAPGRDIRFCMTEREFLPIASTLIEAPGQYLVRLAVQSLGDRAVFVPLPWRRCVEGLRHGDYDGAVGMAAAESFLSFMRFPMLGEQLDDTKALGGLLYVAARLKGARADWDGERFLYLRKPVIYNAPSLLVADKMRRLDVGNANTSLSEEQMLTMLVAGRADIAVGRKNVTEELIAADSSFRERIEILPAPFVAAPSYLAFRKAFPEPSPGYVQRIWDEIGRLKSAPDWAETERRLLAAHKPLKPS